MKEEYIGKAEIKEEVTLMYLGFMLSKKGTNIENIKHKGNRSIGVQKQILKMIAHLGPYTFECALIYIQSLIRNSVLYAAEAMYSIKETDYRALESTEESVLLKVFATKKSCSRHLMYLEAGMVPARYQVQRQVLNFLHYILQQPDTSLIHRVFIAMQLNPTKGDWASFALDLLEKFEMNMSITDIKKMKSSQFKSLVKEKMQKIAFLELTQKQKNGQKGRKIIYRSLSMADYLLPEANLTVEEKRNFFL